MSLSETQNKTDSWYTQLQNKHDSVTGFVKKETTKWEPLLHSFSDVLVTTCLQF